MTHPSGRSAVEIALPDVEEMRTLVIDGREKGFLTYDEIVGALQDAEVTKEQIEDFYSHLLEVGIEVLDADGEIIARRAAQPTERPPELDLTVEPSLDSLRLYLREIGRVPLLTAGRRWPSPAASSAATSPPRPRWSRPTCAWWSASPRATWGAGSRSST